MVYIARKQPCFRKSLKHTPLNKWIADFLAQQPLRANSLVVTVYGDAIAPHGGSVWLGSLITLMQPFGVNARMLRTCVFRLAREQWLESEQVGRRSFYGLTPTGLRRIEHATHRIYDDHTENWQGGWTLVIVGEAGLDKNRRENLRHELVWQGYGQIAPGVFARPDSDVKTLREIIADADATDRIVVMHAQNLGADYDKPLLRMVHQCWNLGEVVAGYQVFLQRFVPLLHALKKNACPDAQQCFLARTLMIHEYRRVMLRDPQLPARLLPRRWPGARARELAQQIYHLTQAGAERHLMAILESQRGNLPKAAKYYFQRFGGLQETERKK